MQSNDGRFFSTQKKGEIHELRNDLNSGNKDKVKDAVKKVIASMTVGKDVSALFTDVIKCMQTDNIELKKLVYLYIINYARSQPDKAILVVNSFQKDAADRNNPLIRALAIRTMGCIRVDRITQFLCDPLSACLRDRDPYVRKTAAVCVAKLYDLNPELVVEQGFLNALRDMISDSNHTVVANAVAALVEISEASGADEFRMNPDLLAKLLSALDACTEWGQVSILDCLAKYSPTAHEAEEIVERVAPRLKHANAAVSMSAIKVITKYIAFIKNPQLEELLLRNKLPPPLITLLSDRRPEIQYVALRNIRLIVQKFPTILANHVKNFFCRYNDPLYVKMEKLEVMIALVSADNAEKVLAEFKEYANEVDVDFVRKAVRAIGRCAIKLPEAADRCVNILLSLIENKVNYVVQEAIVVIKNIFRRYPNEYESIIGTLCESLDSLDEPEAKAAMIWIVGEYGDRIDNAADLLGIWVETFEEEPAMVQLQLLTAVVKLFLKVPAAAKDLVTQVLERATKNTDNPDLRDRGFIYWRMLSANPATTQQVVLAPKEPVTDDSEQLDPQVLDTLMGSLSTLASVYHRLPETFVKDSKGSVQLRRAGAEEEDEDDNGGVPEEEEYHHSPEPSTAPAAGAGPSAAAPAASQPAVIDIFGLGALTAPEASPVNAAPVAQQQPAGDDVFALLGLGGGSAPAPAPAPAASGFDPLGAPAASSASTDPVLLTAEAGHGLVIRGRAGSAPEGPALFLSFENQGTADINSFPVKFNTNYFGVAPATQIKMPLPAGARAQAVLPLKYSSASLDTSAKAHDGTVQVAMKLPLGVAYFKVTIPHQALFGSQGMMTKEQWLAAWPRIPNVSPLAPFRSAASTEEAVVQRLKSAGAVHLATRNIPASGTHMFFASRWRAADALIEVIAAPDGSLSGKVKSEDAAVAQGAATALANVLA